MQIDARPFKAGYSAAFLSKLHHEKIATKRQIARAYFAGANLKDLAEEYGISVQKVMTIAKWYDAQAYQARRLAKAMVEAPALQMPEPEPAERPAIETRPDGTRVYTVEREGIRISLPYVSILGELA